jgi:hypothetical protein
MVDLPISATDPSSTSCTIADGSAEFGSSRKLSKEAKKRFFTARDLSLEGVGIGILWKRGVTLAMKGAEATPCSDP